MNQRGRSVVKQMGIIDEYHQRTRPGPVGHHPAVAPQQLTGVLPAQAVTDRVGRQDRRQRSERQTPRCVGGSRPGHCHPLLLGQLQAGTGQRRLAHTGRTGDHCPPPGDQGGRQLSELPAPADQWPRVHV